MGRGRSETRSPDYGAEKWAAYNAANEAWQRAQPTPHDYVVAERIIVAYFGVVIGVFVWLIIASIIGTV